VVRRVLLLRCQRQQWHAAAAWLLWRGCMLLLTWLLWRGCMLLLTWLILLQCAGLGRARCLGSRTLR
jgi:hypothetical protein